jgi:neurexin
VLNENGDPSTALNNVLAPSLKPKKVTYQGLHQCELVIGKPQTPSLYPKVSNVNYPPTIRNPVDHINATVGRLLVFKVPEVTFLLILLLPFNRVVIVQSLFTGHCKTRFLLDFLFRS